MLEYAKVEHEVVSAKVCDACGLRADRDDDVIEFQEFVSIGTQCGYGSIFRDGAWLSVDLCQHCVKARLGDVLRLKEIW